MAVVGRVYNLFLVLFTCQTFAALMTYDFNLTWVYASPDGFSRPVIGINNRWPIPTIEVELGDNVVINVINHLGNQSASLHFHGLFMNGTSRMDGASMITQCPILPEGRFVYNFTASQVGTYWYHSHTGSQYPDGLRGPLIIRQPSEPIPPLYEDEITLTLSDWYHKEMSELMPGYLSRANTMMQDPKPDAYLMNDMVDFQTYIVPGRTYLFRVLNIGALKTLKFWIEGHDLEVVEVDGISVHPESANAISLATGQRYAFILRTKEDRNKNYAMSAAVDQDADVSMMDANRRMNENAKGPVVSAWLVYNPELELPEAKASPSDVSLNDNSALTPLDQNPLLPEPDVSISLTIDVQEIEDGSWRWMFSDLSYSAPDTPTIFNVLAGQSIDPRSRLFILPHMSIVQLTVYNKHMSGHPLHLHGHAFQVAYLSSKSAGPFKASSNILSPIPMRRDTLMIPGDGNAVLRFRADNPGIWFFHCHMEWHAHSGLAVTFIVAPDRLRAQEPLSLLNQTLESNLEDCVPAKLLKESLSASPEKEFKCKTSGSGSKLFDNILKQSPCTKGGHTVFLILTAVMLLGLCALIGVLGVLLTRHVQERWHTWTRSAGQRYKLIGRPDDETVAG